MPQCFMLQQPANSAGSHFTLLLNRPCIHFLQNKPITATIRAFMMLNNIYVLPNILPTSTSYYSDLKYSPSQEKNTIHNSYIFHGSLVHKLLSLKSSTSLWVMCTFWLWDGIAHKNNSSVSICLTRLLANVRTKRLCLPWRTNACHCSINAPVL